MPSLVSFLHIACLVATSISFAASLSLMVWLCRLDRFFAGKLLARQLYHLALADVLAAAMMSQYFVAGSFGSSIVSASTLDFMCKFGMANDVPFMASLFVEVHIALATVCAIFRFSSAIRGLSMVLPFAWVFGLVVGGIIYVLQDVSWQSELGSCNPKFVGQTLKIVIMACALVICVVTYVVGVVMATRQGGRAVQGGAVQGRAWRRAKWFLVVTLVGWGPYVMTGLLPHGPDEVGFAPGFQIAYYLALIFYSSNGLFNAALYAWLSGFVRQARRRASTRALEIGAPVSRDPTMHSGHVAFNMDDEVVLVHAVTADANATAMTEIAALSFHSRMASADHTAMANHSVRQPNDFLACFDQVDGNPTGVLDHVLQRTSSLSSI